MALSNSELATKLNETMVSWQDFVTQQLSWLLDTTDTVNITDPTTGVVTVPQTLYKIVTDYETILGDNPTRVQQIEDNLALSQTQIDALDALALQFDTQEATIANYATLAENSKLAAQTAESNASTHANTASTSATDAGASADLAADWAEGLENIEVVTGQFSALHHAAKASDSALAAGTSETNAASSATAAGTSETNAAASATAAGTSETNAAASEAGVEADALAAAASETNAAASETAAGTSETNAAASATAASTSETNAAASATAAGTSETNAGSSEVAAAGSATKSQEWAEELEDTEVELGKYSAKHHAAKSSASASGAAASETNAAASATASETSETNAAASAAAAGTSETNAAASEAAAATSETNAAGSAAAAGTSETNAAASETAAGTSETNAAASETAAGTSETNAATSRLKAGEWAEKGVDIEVETGKYSALHWAQKALENSGAALNSTDGLAEGTTNLYFTDLRATDAIKADTAWNAGNWDLAHGWGDHSLEGYLKSFTESDPVFGASPAGGITAIQIGNWDTAYGWGNHANAGYLTSVSWADVALKPTTATRWPSFTEVTSKPATATRWPAWTEVTSKPTTFTPSTHSHTPSEVGLGNVSNAAQVTTTNNTSLNSDSRNSRGVTRLYRHDSSSDYSVQVDYSGGRWRLRGYQGDAFHAGCSVDFATTAGDSPTLSGAAPNTGNSNSTIVKRSSNGDISCRLFRSEYTNRTTNLNNFMVQHDKGGTGDNYLRPASFTEVAAQINIAGNNSLTASQATQRKFPTILTSSTGALLSSAHAGMIFRTTNTSALTLTLTGTTVGTEFVIIRDNTGAVNFAAGSGQSIQSTAGTTPSVKTRYGAATAVCVAANVWRVFGDIE